MAERCTIVQFIAMDAEARLRIVVRQMLDESGLSMRRFEVEKGLKDWDLRGLLDPRRPQSPSLAKTQRICDALGIELYIGRPREPKVFDEPGSAEFSAHDEFAVFIRSETHSLGWGTLKQSDTAPAYHGAADEAAFWVVQEGDEMAPEGIEPGDYVLVSPKALVVEGARVWIEDEQRRTTIKRLLAMGDEGCILRGWLRDGPTMRDFREERLSSSIRRLYAVVAVNVGAPKPDHPPRWRADPRPPGERINPRLARALGISPDASVDDALDAVDELQSVHAPLSGG